MEQIARSIMYTFIELLFQNISLNERLKFYLFAQNTIYGLDNAF